MINVVDDTVATNAGNYSIGFSLVDTVENTWIDDTVEKKSTPWVISPKSVSVPEFTSQDTLFPYTGSDVTVSFTYDSNDVTKTGTDTAVAIGTYNVTFNLNDTVNTQWPNGDTTQITKNWAIGKANLPDPTIVCNPGINNEAQIVITTETSVTITVTREGDGEISLTSDRPIDSTDVTVEGNVITLTNLTGYLGVPLYIEIAEGTNYNQYTSNAIYIAQQQ